MKSYSIIIPNTNSLLIKHILDALQSQMTDHPDGEIIIVGSDRLGLIMPQLKLRFIPTGQNNCCASDKRNLGMRVSDGEIYLFLDDDCLPHPEWLSRHLNRQYNGEKIIGGSVDFSTKHYLQLADNVSAFHDLLPSTAPGPRPYLATANLSVHRSIVQQTGPMIPGKNRADDLEWTTRFRLYGFELKFDPDIIINHDPPRYTLSALWRHWTSDAPDTLRVRLRYAHLLSTPSLAKLRGMYLWGSPLVAAWATARTFSSTRMWLAYGHTIPIVFLTKLAWCWSAYRNFPKNEAYIP